MKKCTKCKNEKELSEFYNGRGKCKDCYSLASKKYYKKNKDKILKDATRYYKDNKDKIQLYYDNNRESIKTRESMWYKNNRHKANAKEAKRRAKKLNATPIWLNEDHLKEIESFYRLAKNLEKQDGTIRHVDHIIPLQGKTACGLHVPWNLRVITAEENLSKGNNVIE